jgi:hypothetical protein
MAARTRAERAFSSRRVSTARIRPGNVRVGARHREVDLDDRQVVERRQHGLRLGERAEADLAEAERSGEWRSDLEVGNRSLEAGHAGARREQKGLGRVEIALRADAALDEVGGARVRCLAFGEQRAGLAEQRAFLVGLELGEEGARLDFLAVFEVEGSDVLGAVRRDGDRLVGADGAERDQRRDEGRPGRGRHHDRWRGGRQGQDVVGRGGLLPELGEADANADHGDGEGDQVDEEAAHRGARDGEAS